MTDASVSEFIKEVEDLIDKIWEKPPVEIKNVKEIPKIAPLRPFFGINYAFHLLSQLRGTLITLTACARNGVSIDSIKSVTTAVIKSKCVFIEITGLTETLQLLGKTCKVIEGIENICDYVDITDRLCIYLGKLSDRGWLDLEMHWKEVSSAYDIIDSLK